MIKTLRMILLGATATVALLLTTAAPAPAHYMGMKWSLEGEYTRTVWIYDATGDYRWRVSTAAWEWNHACSRLKFGMTKDIKKANIVVHEKDLPSPRAGETQVAWSGDYIVGQVHMYLDTYVAKYSWARNVTRHEMGHAWGADHNNLGSLSVMGTAGTIQAHDRTDLRKFYGIRYTTDCPGGRWAG